MGCRVVGTRHSNPFMTDFLERRSAVERFFAAGSTAGERLSILSEYSVSYVLVPKTCEGAVGDFVVDLEIVDRNAEYVMYDVGQDDFAVEAAPSR